jgi:hypothetical protein
LYRHSDEAVVICANKRSPVESIAACAVATTMDPDKYRKTSLTRDVVLRRRLDLLYVNARNDGFIDPYRTFKNKQSSLVSELSTCVSVEEASGACGQVAA